MLQAFSVNSSPEDALHFFESVPCRNVVSWNALLAAFAQRGRLAEASRTFEMMPQLELASWNTMITAFANTGYLSRGRELFATMPEFDIISWNTLIAGYAENASYKTAVELFRELNLEGLKPTESTFVGLLIGCNRGGKVKRAHEHFVSMITQYGLRPELDHYGCMVEVLGRAKQLGHAEELLHEMPFFPGPVAWTSYLSSCRMHGDFKRAAQAAQHLMELDPENKSMYQLLANMYTEKAAAQQQQQQSPMIDGEVVPESFEQKNLLQDHHEAVDPAVEPSRCLRLLSIRTVFLSLIMSCVRPTAP
ncbi:hypothetical protein SELMODRAFT_442794 [Selaginella moellendorffii]|uniref:Pentacotripeptide-repeat region of PRORP domain-containing protein n=1 Tax=Selaginella moellendorffii TaxID=88036 RepID=D8RW85_SELML|nr:hypothetical protein SELMODRAFT_442794 [Selaginella moellendorffii]